MVKGKYGSVKKMGAVFTEKLQYIQIIGNKWENIHSGEGGRCWWVVRRAAIGNGGHRRTANGRPYGVGCTMENGLHHRHSLRSPHQSADRFALTMLNRQLLQGQCWVGGLCAVFWWGFSAAGRHSSSVSPDGEPPSPRGKGFAACRRCQWRDCYSGGHPTPLGVTRFDTWLDAKGKRIVPKETDCHTSLRTGSQ